MTLRNLELLREANEIHGQETKYLVEATAKLTGIEVAKALATLFGRR